MIMEILERDFLKKAPELVKVENADNVEDEQDDNSV
jgi:hypothetical protein